MDRLLSLLNIRNWSEDIPGTFANLYDHEKYAKARRYQQTKFRFSNFSGGFSTILMLIMLIAGGFGWLDDQITNPDYTYFMHAGVFFAILFIGSDILGLPFSIYGTFGIEQKFGFNKTTPVTFIVDKIKGYILSLTIGGGILYILIAFYDSTQSYFWLYGWGIIVLFMIISMAFYTSLILPIFNKLKPLEKGELRDAIETYCEKVGYDLKRIYVMNGSKRSTKANAFFSGIGKRKTIVLYDTLIENHSTEELVAVLAHEVGHYKKKHTMQSLVIGILNSGIMMYLLSLFISDDNLARALGAERASFHIGLVGFSLIYSPVSTITGILMNVLSRKNEFEADAYAKNTYAGEPLEHALKKLSVDNLGNLSPHPWYVFVYYSHPPLIERLNALQK